VINRGGGALITWCLLGFGDMAGQAHGNKCMKRPVGDMAPSKGGKHFQQWKVLLPSYCIYTCMDVIGIDVAQLLPSEGPSGFHFGAQECSSYAHEHSWHTVWGQFDNVCRKMEHQM